jgi:hypothetical protein
MRLELLLPSAALVVLVNGCGNQQHPSYSAFKHVSGKHMTSIKNAIENGPIKHIELPTSLPFTVTEALMQTNMQTFKQTKHFSLWMSGGNHVLTITAWPDPTNQPPSKKVIHVQNEQVTQLSHGKKAIYGNNGRASMLDWAQNGVEYSISSINVQSKPDLTKEQLVKVAQSFS